MADPLANRELNEPEDSAGTGESTPLAVPTEFTARRLVLVQCLRGVAALMVVFYHAQNQSPGFLAVCPTGVGKAGVDLFFVISGFVMVYVTSNREQSPQQFLAFRVARIVPVYWFFTLSASALMYILPQLFKTNELSFKHVVLSLLFIPHRSGRNQITAPVIEQGWTLNLEVFFYVIFAIAMAISLRRRAALAGGLLVVMAAVGYGMFFTGFSIGAADIYFAEVILEFAIGMLIATAYLQGEVDRIGAVGGASLVVGGFVVMYVLDGLFARIDNRGFIAGIPASWIVYGLPAAVIVVGALALESRSRALRIPMLQFAGDASYSIYLVHIFPIAILRAIWPRWVMPMEGFVSFVLFVALSMVSAVALGAASYYGVERTSLRYLRKKIERLLP